jgi:hypothetical protein
MLAVVQGKQHPAFTQTGYQCVEKSKPRLFPYGEPIRDGVSYKIRIGKGTKFHDVGPIGVGGANSRHQFVGEAGLTDAGGAR